MTKDLEKEHIITASSFEAGPVTAQAKRTAAKPKKAEEDDLEEVAPKRSGSGSTSETDDEDVEGKEDDRNKEEDDDLDPDFEEFDLPKSKKGKAGKDSEEDDLKIEEDEEFKDLFNDGGRPDDDEEDF